MLFPSLPEDASVRHALAINERTGDLLCQFHEELLRGDSPLSIMERELIAAYVSGLNRCNFCRGTHEETALLLGVPKGQVSALLADDELTEVSEKLRPILAYARKLTLDHQHITKDDVAAVFEAGWSERALHDAILIAATFNFMNRFVHGHGIEGDPALHAERGRFLFENGYLNVVGFSDGQSSRHGNPGETVEQSEAWRQQDAAASVGRPEGMAIRDKPIPQ